MRFVLFSTAVAAALLAVAATAQTKSFVVELIGEQQVPPVRTGGIGTAIVQVDTASGAVSVAGRYTNLSSNALAAHIHGSARRGANAGVVVGLTVSGGTGGTLSGTGRLTPAQLRDLLDGLMYVNLHTATNPGGEIRAQIDVVPGSGSANTTASPTISGDATPGGTLRAGCPPSIDRAFVLIGLALPACQTVTLPPPIACAAPSELVFDLIITPLAVSGPSATIPIPNGLPAFHASIQCVFLSLQRGCVNLSAGARIAIR